MGDDADDRFKSLKVLLETSDMMAFIVFFLSRACDLRRDLLVDRKAQSTFYNCSTEGIAYRGMYDGMTHSCYVFNVMCNVNASAYCVHMYTSDNISFNLYR